MKIGRPNPVDTHFDVGYPANGVRWVIRDQPVIGNDGVLERVLVLQQQYENTYFSRSWQDVQIEIKDGETDRG